MLTNEVDIVGWRMLFFCSFPCIEATVGYILEFIESQIFVICFNLKSFPLGTFCIFWDIFCQKSYVDLSQKWVQDEPTKIS